jgi:hypothetical protein
MARGDIRRQSSASRRSALARQNLQFPPQKYPITSVCRPATGSMVAVGTKNWPIATSPTPRPKTRSRTVEMPSGLSLPLAFGMNFVLVQDNLNIHSKASLYQAFPAIEARRLVERFEWHYTPNGSWLDLAESELSVLSSQCLDRRIPNKQTLVEEIAAWEHDRNATHTKANWHFSTSNARIKLKHLYPAI